MATKELKKTNDLIVHFGQAVNRCISKVANEHDCKLSSDDGCKVCESLYEMREEIRSIEK